MRRRRPVIPDESVIARVCVLVAMEVGLIGMGITANMPLTAAVAMPVVAWGHVVSWRGRRRPRTVQGQLTMGLLLALALAYLFADLFNAAFGGDLPQARFAVIAAVITSFDLKARRNLYSHLWHSLALVYIAGLFAWSALFLVLLVGWGLCMAGFYATGRTEAAALPGSAPSRPFRRRNVTIAAVWLLSAAVVFVGLPELPGRPVAMPMLLGVPHLNSSADALPSALPLVGGVGSPAGGAINLRARGALGDEVVFHVRSPQPAYWRAYSLDVYDGQGWQREPQPGRTILGLGGRNEIDDESLPRNGPTLTQTFFIERPIPSQMPGAYPVEDVYVSDPLVQAYPDGTLSTSGGLDRGASYGVVSAMRDTSPQRLRTAGMETAPPSDWAALQLPQSVTQRTMALAASLAAGRPTEYDRVLAIQTYLTSTYRYSLEAPVPPAGSDAVDRFLFTDRVGFCEQFASALVVMLRSQGIPARVAIGWATGDHDALTGTYTVRNRDAHAWAEVLFPGVGWVPFDATPGADPNPGGSGSSQLFDLGSLVRIGGVPGGPQAVGSALIGVAVMLVFFLVAGWVRERRGQDPLLRRYAAEQRRLRRRRLPWRGAGETVSEHLARLGAAAAAEAGRLEPLARAVEDRLYG